jgi:Flp pilus assembly protein TadG
VTGSGPVRDPGAVVVIVAVMLVALMAVAALAVDLGHEWQARRGLITATDAAALAAAQRYAGGLDGCDTVDANSAYALVAANQPSATVQLCDPHGTTVSGYVTVNATQPVDLLFGPIIGKSTGTAKASTTARWGAKTVESLRPFALCSTDSDLAAWVANPVPGTPIELTLDNQKSSTCNGSGEWGLVDYTNTNGGASNPQLETWLDVGYDGPHEFCRGPVVAPCDAMAIDTEAGNKVTNNRVRTAIDQLVTDGTVFWTPVVQASTGTGSGGDYPIVAFVGIKITFFEPNFTASLAKIDIEAETLFNTPSVPCCPLTEVPGTTPSVEICAVDPNSAAAGCT